MTILQGGVTRHWVPEFQVNMVFELLEAIEGLGAAGLQVPVRADGRLNCHGKATAVIQ